MDRKLLNCIEDKLWQVLEEYANGFKGPSDGFKGPSDVETVKHALSGIFKIKCMEEMDDFKGGSFRGGRSYDGGRSYTYYDEGSFRGGTSRDGRGSYGGPYGGSYDMDMRAKLEELMRTTTDERQRHIIQDMMNKLR